MKAFSKQILLLLLLCLLASNAHGVSETQIKAVFLEKFTHLIEWPQDDNESFVICVVKDKNFASALKEIYTEKSFKNKKVKILNIEEGEKIPNCQLLFIGKSTKNINRIISSIGTRSVLTVSDNKDNIPEDVMITMFLNKSRFKYIINNRAAQKANVKISYLLLKSAQEVIK